MPNKWQTYFSLVVNITVILVISKLATNSLNPMEVFRGESLFLKIIVGFFSFILFMSILFLLFRGRLEDKRCAGEDCGRSLLDFAGPLGGPVRCNYCGRWFHKNCFTRGGGSVLTGCKQPGCETARTDFA